MLEVECIAKGKAHKKYEFGCKVSITTRSKDNFVVGAQALHYNSYDGHTLNEALEQAERLGDFEAKEVYVNRGYRAHDYEGSVKVHLARLRNEKGEAIVEALVERSVGNRTGDRSYENRWVVGQKLSAWCGR